MNKSRRKKRKLRTAIPLTIDLRFAIIHITQLTKAAMREEAECDPDEYTPEGLWDVGEDTIYVGRWLSPTRKRQVLMHELVHAALDYSEEGKYETEY